MVSTTGFNTPTPSQPYTVFVYCTLTQGRGKDERVEPERRLEGQQQFTNLDRKYQHD
jgi:hypothetical protein